MLYVCYSIYKNNFYLLNTKYINTTLRYIL